MLDPGDLFARRKQVIKVTAPSPWGANEKG